MNTRTKGISPKLAAAISPPLTAVVTAIILTGEVDRSSLAALAAIGIAAVLGYQAPSGPLVNAGAQPVMGGTMSSDARPALDDDDGDDAIPAELEPFAPTENPPPDEIDLPDPNHPEVK